MFPQLICKINWAGDLSEMQNVKGSEGKHRDIFAISRMGKDGNPQIIKDNEKNW